MVTRGENGRSSRGRTVDWIDVTVESVAAAPDGLYMLRRACFFLECLTQLGGSDMKAAIQLSEDPVTP
jgi:hypothetical protein